MEATRTRNGLLAVILVALAGAGVLLFLPSGKQKREESFRQDLAKRVTFASDKDFEVLQGSSEFVIHTPRKKLGDLYLFMPASNNNIALVASPRTNSFIVNDLRDIDIHIIPVTEKNSPSTNLALKLALANPGPLGQSFINEVGQHPLVAMKRLKPAWEELPEASRTQLEQQVQSNQDRLLKCGKFQAFLSYGTYKMKGESWGDFRTPLYDLRQFYKGN